ncbi:MAG: hypothetical protein L0H53_07340 [Candidatus Nitrosocosmicus sp.]|nr:hypothetical protein [Candidatus Nitrosocosmicus sp.]MDN5867449.1 hypothetical protein [Candidatus Nitrosocosmicus sp.]
MYKLLVIVAIALAIVSGQIGPIAQSSYATTTLRQSQEPSEAEESGTESERQSQAREELSNAVGQQENANDAESKDEQIINGEQNDNENSDDNEEQVNIDKAPVAISDGNVFVVWFTDQNTLNSNSEVLFRSSTDGGTTFVDKVNLSNTTDADSINAEIAADGDTVIVTWWERNATSIEPVTRTSIDSGQTFGPLLRLATNGTVEAPLE